jgi:hypothetical protein
MGCGCCWAECAHEEEAAEEEEVAEEVEDVEERADPAPSSFMFSASVIEDLSERLRWGRLSAPLPCPPALDPASLLLTLQLSL